METWQNKRSVKYDHFYGHVVINNNRSAYYKTQQLEMLSGLNMAKETHLCVLWKYIPSLAAPNDRWNVVRGTLGQGKCAKISETQFNENHNAFLLSGAHSFSTANSLLYSWGNIPTSSRLFVNSRYRHL